MTEIKTSRSGDRRFGPRHASLLQKLHAAKEKVPIERKRLSTKWQSLDEYSGKWLRGEQSGDGTPCKHSVRCVPRVIADHELRLVL